MPPAVGEELQVVSDHVGTAAAVITRLTNSPAFAVEFPGDLSPRRLWTAAQARDGQKPVLRVPSERESAVVGHVPVQIVAEGFGRLGDKNVAGHGSFGRRGHGHALPNGGCGVYDTYFFAE